MKIYKKSLLLVICVLLIIGASLSVYATEEDHTSLADYLKEIEVFLGTDTGYHLEESTKRVQAAVMVVRLLGKEDEALAQNLGHPFDDVPKWASPYVGYLWQNHITNGINATTFGSNNSISGLQYMTFLLRVLSYDDSKGDFSWSESIKKAYELGILSQEDYNYYLTRKTFLRDDLVVFTYEALEGDIKDGNGISLLRHLMDQQVVPQTAMLDYLYAPYLEGSNYTKPSNSKEFQDAILQGIVAYKDSIQIDLSQMKVTNSKDMINAATDRLIELPAYASILEGWSSSTTGNIMTLSFDYLISKAKFDQAISEAYRVAGGLFSLNQSDYDKELIIHDYIVDHCQYYPGTDNPNEIYTIYGLFINKQAVCQAYADAFFYLSSYAGLESSLVYGEGESDTGTQLHAWNVIELEGENYGIDTTWDDPVGSPGEAIKLYNYFNITDKEMDINHNWIQEKYPISNGIKYNYFAYNRLVVSGEQGLRTALTDGFNASKSEMIFKVKDVVISDSLLRGLLNDISGYYSCLYSIDATVGIVRVMNIQY